MLLVLPASAGAYVVDLVPVGPGSGGGDLSGVVSIEDGDGKVVVTVDGIDDGTGDPLDGTVTLQMRMRVNGARRRLLLAVPVDGGEGGASTSLELAPGARIVVRDVRLRGPDRRTLALGGAVTQTPAAPPPDNCPAALAACQADLDSCSADLGDCQLGP